MVWKEGFFSNDDFDYDDTDDDDNDDDKDDQDLPTINELIIVNNTFNVYTKFSESFKKLNRTLFWNV